MKAFVSWSGGKDCTLALHYFLKDNDNEVLSLVNITSENHNAHRTDFPLFSAQSEAMGIPLIHEKIEEGKTYEYQLKKTIAALKEKGAEAGIFGDIYLQVHRDWIERVCDETGIKAVFPLWGKDTGFLINDFVDNGFQTIIIAIKKDKELSSILGKVIDKNLIEVIRQIGNIDLCGENGEYHTFVFDGPLFTHKIPLKSGEIYEDKKGIYQPLSIDISA